NNTQVGQLVGEWAFPDGGVLAKTVSINVGWDKPAAAGAGPPSASLRRLETQILHFDVDTWKAYNYIWNDEQTDAILADDVGSDRKLLVAWDTPACVGAGPRTQRQQTWPHASRTESLHCHTSRVGTVL